LPAVDSQLGCDQTLPIMADDTTSARDTAPDAIPPFPVSKLPAPPPETAPPPPPMPVRFHQPPPFDEAATTTIMSEAPPPPDIAMAGAARPTAAPAIDEPVGDHRPITPPLPASAANRPPPLPPQASSPLLTVAEARRVDDRHWLLALAGILWVVLGFALAAHVPITLAREGGITVLGQWRQAVPLLLDHFVGPAALVVLGVGSMFGKRWARHLLLAIATLVFALGLATLVAQALFAWRDGWLPRDLAGLARLGAAALAVLALPWFVIAFYSHRRTRLACEALNPRPAWTDHLPEGMIIIFVLCLVLTRHLAVRIFDSPFPAFGQMIDGQAGEAAWAGAAAFFLLTALVNTRRRALGWWLALLGFTFMAATFVWTVLLGPPDAAERSWTSTTFKAPDAGLFVAAVFMLSLLLLGSIARHYRPAAAP
jgi:hypothetical protein